jgi:hypothetical protein
VSPGDGFLERYSSEPVVVFSGGGVRAFGCLGGARYHVWLYGMIDRMHWEDPSTDWESVYRYGVY